MTSSQLRKKLHQFIDVAEEKKLNAIYVMVEEEMEAHSMLNNKQKAELDQRLDEYMQGKGEEYTWKDASARIRKRKERK